MTFRPSAKGREVSLKLCSITEVLVKSWIGWAKHSSFELYYILSRDKIFKQFSLKFFFATQSCSRQWNNFLDYQAFVRYGQKSNEWVDFVEVVRYYIVSIEGGMGGGGEGGQKGGQKLTTLKTSQQRANSNSTCSHTKLFSYVITTAIKFDKVISCRHA